MAGPARTIPGGAGHPAENLVSYIIRRLIAAVGLVIVISMITFAIFYLMPRLAGATPETLAARYVGRTPNARPVKQTAEALGFYDPVPVQYWHWLQGRRRRATTYDMRRRRRALPGAVPGLLLPAPTSRCCPRSCSASP